MERFIPFVAMLAASCPAVAEIIGMNVSRAAREEDMKASIGKVELEDEAGDRIALRDLIGNGRPSLITLWAHWCVNCRAEMADYKVIAASCPGRWNVIFISSRPADFGKDLAKYRSYGLPWTLTSPKRRRSRRARGGRFTARRSGEVITPLHYLVSASGKVDAIVNARMNLAEPKKLAAFCR